MLYRSIVSSPFLSTFHPHKQNRCGFGHLSKVIRDIEQGAAAAHRGQVHIGIEPSWHLTLAAGLGSNSHLSWASFAYRRTVTAGGCRAITGLGPRPVTVVARRYSI